jgi:hypothetical protein
MSVMSEVVPLPSFGEVFFDARGHDRVLRVTWHEGTLVLSLWRGEMCTGSFRMPMDDVDRLIDTLDEGFAEAGGQYADDGKDPGATGPMPRQDGGEYAQHSDHPAHPGDYPGTGQHSRPVPGQRYPEQQHHGDQGYGDPQYGDPQYADPQYADPQYADPQYANPQYPDPQYPDPQYANPQYANPQYADQHYADQQHYPEQYPGQAGPPQHPAGANDVLVARGAPPREVPRERPFTGGQPGQPGHTGQPGHPGHPGYPPQQPGTVDPSDPLGLGQGGRPYPQQDYQQEYPQDPMYATGERMRQDQRPEPRDDQRVW